MTNKYKINTVCKYFWQKSIFPSIIFVKNNHNIPFITPLFLLSWHPLTNSRHPVCDTQSQIIHVLAFLPALWMQENNYWTHNMKNYSGRMQSASFFGRQSWQHLIWLPVNELSPQWIKPATHMRKIANNKKNWLASSNNCTIIPVRYLLSSGIFVADNYFFIRW